jgi:hypothetical protein
VKRECILEADILSLIISTPLGQKNERIQDIYPSWSRDQDTEILNHPVHQTQTFSYFGPSKLSPARWIGAGLMGELVLN